MTDTVYQWPGGLGRKVCVADVPVEMTMCNATDGSWSGVHCALVQHLYSGRYEWVRKSRLSVYYGDNQPEGK